MSAQSRPYFSIFIVSLWLFAAIGASWLDLNPNQLDLPHSLVAPNSSALLGYDDLGRPMLDRLLQGAQVSFYIAFWVIGLSALIGTLIGLIAGWSGGWLDHVLTRIIDIFMAFPGILLAIALAGVMGAGLINIVIALTTVGWVGFARLARAQTFSVKQREHIQAARALGTTTSNILIRHILPLILAPLIVEATFGIASVIIAEAGLSFLGLGIQAPDPSWGSMIRDGTRYMLIAPHMVIVPGVALCLVVLAVNLLGDYLRDRFDRK